MANDAILRFVIEVDDKGQASVKQFGDEAEKAGEKGEKGFAKFGAALEANSRRLLAASAAIAAVGGVVTKMAADFDTGLREVNTLVNLSEDGFADLKQAVLDIDPALGNTRELTEGLYNTISAGISDPVEAIGFLEQASVAAKAGVADLGVSVEAGTKVLAGFSSQGVTSTEVFDKLFTTVALGQTKFGELASVAGGLAASASNLNINMDELFGSLAQVTLTAGSTAQAATQVESVMTALITPTDRMAEVLKRLGDGTAESAIANVGFVEVLKEIQAESGGSSLALGELFGRKEAMAGFLSLGSAGFADVSDKISQMADSAGAAQRAFEEQQKSAGAAFERLRNTLERVGIQLGSVILPIVADMADKLAVLAAKFTELGPGTQKAIVAFGAIAGALTGIAGTVGLLIGPLTSMGGALLTAGKFAITLVSSLNPVVAVMLAVAAATAAVTAGIVAYMDASSRASAEASNMAQVVQSLRTAINFTQEQLAQWVGELDNTTRAMVRQRTETLLAGTLTDELREKYEGVIAALDEYETEQDAAATATVDTSAALAALNEAATTAAGGMNTATVATTDLNTILQELGVTTAAEAAANLDKVAAAVDSGQIPTAQLQTIVQGLREEYEKLGVVTPEVEAKLRGIEDAARSQGAIIEQQLTGAMFEATDATNLFAGAAGALPPVLKTNAFAAADAAAGFLGLTQEQALAVTGMAETAQEAAILAAKLRGEYGPAIQDSTNRMLGLEQATTASTVGLGSFFGGLKTGIPAIDGFLGKIDGLLGGFGGIVSSLFGGGDEGGGGGIGGAISSFFGKVTGGLKSGAGGFFDGIKSIFGGGAEGGGLLGSIFGTGEGGGIGGAISGFFGKLTGGVQEGAGGFFGALKGIFGGGGEGGGLGGIFSALGGEGAGGFLGGLGGILGKAANFIPVVGPLISAFAGPLFKGIKALGGKVFGAIKGLFGGPDAAELEARKIGNSLNDVLRGILSTEQQAEAAAAAVGTANDQWAVSNIAIRDSYLAAGFSAEQAQAATDRLAESVRKSPQEAQAAADAVSGVVTEVQAAMAATGLTLTELRNKAINTAASTGVSVQEAFAALAAGTTETLTATAAAAVSTTAQASAAIVETNTTAMATVAATSESTTAAQVANIQVVEQATAESAAAIVVTEEQKAAALQQIADLTLQAEKAALDETQKAELDAARNTVVTWQAANEAIASSSAATAAIVGEAAGAMEARLSNVANVGAGAFDSIKGAARDAVDGALSEFDRMSEELVGASIIPDMVNASSDEIMRIGDAAATSATNVTGAFEGAAGAVGDELRQIKARLAAGVDDPDERRRLDRRVDELTAQATTGRREGGRFSRSDGDADRRRRDREGGGGIAFGGGGGGDGGNIGRVVININGAQDPAATAAATKVALEGLMRQRARAVGRRRQR